MKLRAIFLLTQASVLLAACAYKQAKIVGGQSSIPHSHPYMVSLQLRFLWLRAHICGGSLLNENWVLTAAHCVSGSWLLRWLSMDAIAGLHNVDNFGTRAQVATIDQRVVHTSYAGDIGPHDIAVLKTKTPFTFTREVQPILLPQPNFKYADIETLSLTGWGVLRTTMFLPALPSQLQEVDVTYVPYKECYQAIDDLNEGDNPLDENSNICTGPLTGGVAACSGDSGGPLVYYLDADRTGNTTNDVEDEDDDEDEDDADVDYDGKGVNGKKLSKEDIPIILGIVSWGVTPCGLRGAPSVYTKVTPHLDFINRYINT